MSGRCRVSLSLCHRFLPESRLSLRRRLDSSHCRRCNPSNRARWGISWSSIGFLHKKGFFRAPTRSDGQSSSPASHEATDGFAPPFLQRSKCLLCRALHVAPVLFVGFPNPLQPRGSLLGVLLQRRHRLLVLGTSGGTGFTEAFLMFFDLRLPDIDLCLDLVCELLLQCHIRFSFAHSLQCFFGR